MFGLPWVEIVGLVAGFLSVCSTVPQSLKILKEKKADAVSTRMFIMLLASYILWLVYGLMSGAASIIFWYSIGSVFAAIVLGLKIKYSWKDNR
ncbi:MAG: SemiSWEET family sugar transporter [Alphaproteobacteria bacterium]